MRGFPHTLIVLLLVGLGCLAGTAYAQSACQVNSQLGMYICTSDELSRINAQTDAILAQKARQLGHGQLSGLISGVDAWYEATDENCYSGRSFVYSCVREMLISRRDALRAVDGSRAFVTVDGAVWINLASRISRQAAIDLAYEYYDRTGRRHEFNVFLSRNGWYAISYGPVWSSDFRRHLSRLQDAYWDIDPASFPTRGDGYTVFVTSVRAPRQPPPAPSQTSGRCSRQEVEERRASCFVFAVGEELCTEGLEEIAADRRSAGSSIGASLVCSSAAQAIRQGRIDLGDLAISGALAGVDAIGRGLMQEGDLVSYLMGGVLRASVLSAQFTRARECARAEERRCGY